MALTTGEKLGPYEILASIGAGGMGEVYRARDTRLNREVAIKVSAERFSERFEREARAIASLNHPNICTLFDVGPNYLVMELVEGRTLAGRIKEGAIPFDDALEISRQIAAALEAAHDKGIVHRDLKPGNIKLKHDGTVKVLDFGLAKVASTSAVSAGDPELSPTISMAATQAGVILGTAAYMAPEQARGKPVDKRADIWAFGVVLYEMVTGRRLFQGEDLTDTLASVVKIDPDLSAAPPRIRRVLERCLEKDPRKRLRDISAVEILLEEAPATAAFVPAPARSSKLPWIAAAAALVIAAAGWLLYLRGPEAPRPSVVRFRIPAPKDTRLGTQLRISPDGKMIAFYAFGAGDPRGRLWLRRLDSEEARPIPGTEGAKEGVFWLPDSRTIVFSLGGKLRKMDVNGGPAQPICDFNGAVGGGFLTANNMIAFGTPSTLGVQECPAGGGAAKPITAFKPGGQEAFHAFPSLLPDGKHFLFWRSAGPDTGIYAGSLDAKPDQQTGRRVLPDNSSPIYATAPGGAKALLFVRERTLMAQGFDGDKIELLGDPVPLAENLENMYSFSASLDGRLAYLMSGGDIAQLTWFDLQGKKETIGNPGPRFSQMSISPDGTRMAGSRGDPGGSGSTIWIVDLAQGSEVRLTTDPSDNAVPVWSPDGKKIAFSSSRDGTSNLYLRAADGAGSDELLLKTGERKLPLDWSRDGRFLLFNSGATKGRDIWVLPMDGPPGERKPIPYLHTDADESSARFSPDGRFVAYVSNESGSDEVYVRPFDPAAPEASGSGPGKIRVSASGGSGAAWSKDGKLLAYGTADRKLWFVDVTPTPTLRFGTPRQVREVPLGAAAPSPDLQRVLVDVPQNAQDTSIGVMLNWPPALKK